MKTPNNKVNLDKLMEVLNFYAEPENYKLNIVTFGTLESNVALDGGKTAREILRRLLEGCLDEINKR